MTQQNQLQLSDFFTPSGYINRAVALIEASPDSSDFLYRSDSGLTGTLLGGSLDLATSYPVTRIRRRSDRIQLNDNSATASIGAFFSAGGAGREFRLHLQDGTGVVSLVIADSIHSSGGNNIQFNTDSAFQTVLNRIGDGDRFILAFTEPNPPGLPTSVVADVQSSSEVELTWAAPSEGGPVDAFEVEYKKAADSGWTASTDDISPVRLTGLDASTTYNFRVRAGNEELYRRGGGIAADAYQSG